MLPCDPMPLSGGSRGAGGGGGIRLGHLEPLVHNSQAGSLPDPARDTVGGETVIMQTGPNTSGGVASTSSVFHKKLFSHFVEFKD